MRTSGCARYAPRFNGAATRRRAALARVAECHPRIVQRAIEALIDRFDAPLEFSSEKNGFHFTDPAWKLPSLVLTEGELINFFAVERILRRLDATSEVQLARSALRSLAHSADTLDGRFLHRR
jgi:predicted DNA-binding transcriptional regulator YafY